MKKRSKWGKPMNKPKDPKTPNSFQTLAGVSMMMLQPITAGAGSTSTPDLVSWVLKYLKYYTRHPVECC